MESVVSNASEKVSPSVGDNTVNNDESAAKKPKTEVATDTVVNETECNKKKKKKNRKKKQNHSGDPSTSSTITSNANQTSSPNSQPNEKQTVTENNQNANVKTEAGEKPTSTPNKNHSNTKVEATSRSVEKLSEAKPNKFKNNQQNNKETFNKSNPFAKNNKNVSTHQSSNLNKSTHQSSNPNKSFAKGNPFNTNLTKTTNVSLPPLRQNKPKTKPFNNNGKFREKFGGNKKTFKGKPSGSGGDGKSISDERLKAYGINPKKFHKKQKYSGSNNQQKQE